MTLSTGPNHGHNLRALLREGHLLSLNRLRHYLGSSRFWMVMAACIIVTAITGPFNTLAVMGVGKRLVYWSLILIPAVLLQFYISVTLREMARRTDRPWAEASLVAGLIGSVFIVNWALWVGENLIIEARSFQPSFVIVSASAVVVALTLVVNAFMPTLQPLWGFRKSSAAKRPVIRPLSQSETEPSPFFDRLPPDLGRNVICVRAANHHIEVTTTRGHTRVLMRLADAEGDLTTLPGMRVHRSWWVNLTKVETVETGPSKMCLVLITGARVPVSRAMHATVAARLQPTVEG